MQQCLEPTFRLTLGCNSLQWFRTPCICLFTVLPFVGAQAPTELPCESLGLLKRFEQFGGRELWVCVAAWWLFGWASSLESGAAGLLTQVPATWAGGGALGGHYAGQVPLRLG